MQSLSSASSGPWAQVWHRGGARGSTTPEANLACSYRAFQTAEERQDAKRFGLRASPPRRLTSLCCSARSPLPSPADLLTRAAPLLEQQLSSDEREKGAEASASQVHARRLVVTLPAVLMGTFLASTRATDTAEAAESVAAPPSGAATPYTDMPALRGKDYGKTQMRYADYTLTESGLQFKDLREGNGPSPRQGQTVVVDWAGFTIGYYGRIFEARNKAKGGSFEGNEKEFFRFQVGRGQVIEAFEEAVASMHVGGVRRIIVPPELGYPNNDFNQKGPRPITFSGQRALDFVLKNQGLIDKTLLFDIELLRIVEG
eukprot:TRINITY_DN677_c0_g1_i4.p1 TRINITY_DN677_c0_g1~~TRINITY_DN677_c0_g1_i4.p1  ORF type:complete len:315 (-),score=66.63 TRINITY_DN677_c0_g1_i4:558-1502(-)